MTLTKKYNMGPTRAYRTPAPSKLKLTTHNGRTVAANPQGVPAKWLPIYLELAAGMLDGGPSFVIGKDENEPGKPVTLQMREGNGDWITYKDPAHVARTLGIDAPSKPAPTPRKAPAPKPVTAPKVESPTVKSELPTWAEEWLAGLVFELKRDYARQYLAHILCDAPAPKCPGTEWAGKARKRADRLAELAEVA